MMTALAQELSQRVGVSAACDALNVPRSRLYPRQSVSTSPRPTPAHALSSDERAAVRSVLNSASFMDRAPRQIYATLLDEGTYLCHWRTMYRILHDFSEVRERRNQRQHPVYQKPELLAVRPNEVWSWDITKLRGPAKWTHFALYTVIDIFSRFIVGWMIAERESAELARQLIATAAANQGIQPEQLTLHADNGKPMKAKTLALLLSDLGIEKVIRVPMSPMIILLARHTSRPSNTIRLIPIVSVVFRMHADGRVLSLTGTTTNTTIPA